MNKEIKDKIEAGAEKYGFQVPYNGTNDFYNEDKLNGFLKGAEFGYSLAEAEIKELKEDNGRLKNEKAMIECSIDGMDIELTAAKQELTSLKEKMKTVAGEAWDAGLAIDKTKLK